MVLFAVALGIAHLKACFCTSCVRKSLTQKAAETGEKDQCILAPFNPWEENIVVYCDDLMFQTMTQQLLAMSDHCIVYHPPKNGNGNVEYLYVKH